VISLLERRGTAGGCSPEVSATGGGSSILIGDGGADGAGGADAAGGSDGAGGAATITGYDSTVGAVRVGCFFSRPEYRRLLIDKTFSTDIRGRLGDLLGCRLHYESGDACR
jgi:hypothetical protein